MKGMHSLLIFFMIILDVNPSEDVSSVVGSTVTLQCPLKAVLLSVTWATSNQQLSSSLSILSSVQPNEFRYRLSITFVDAHYHLRISNLKKSDQEIYFCSNGWTTDSEKTLIVIVGPTSVSLDNKIDNKLQGTEGQDLKIRCTAVGGDPKPDVIIKIGNNGAEYRGTSGAVEHILSAIDRSYDGTQVFCRSDYPGVQYQPRSDEGHIHLISGPTSVSVENQVNNKLKGTEGQDLKIRCTAVGGNPKPDVIIQIGNNGPEFRGTGGEVEHIVPAIDRSYDGTPVGCRSDYPGVQYQPRTDFSFIHLISGPTSVSFENKINITLQGTEEQDMRIKCTAVGGDPKPDVIIQIGTNGPEYRGTGGFVEHTIPAIERSYDGIQVFCRSDYPGVQYQPRSDYSSIYLNLKPLSPIFKPDPISREETEQLVLTCSSTGSRPAPTERIWLLGDSSMDITSSSTVVSQSQDPLKAGTYVATSTLTYIVHKQYNGKSIICGFKNFATGSEFVKSSIQVDVKYAPVITVQNNTFEVTDVSRKLQCVLDGNPNSFSYSHWEHRSKYGEHIRYLRSSQSLELPISSENKRYQDTGEYICTANNGILNIQNQLDQKGSGYVISKASPMFLNGSSQILIGQIGSNVTIEVDVYSEPKVTELIWYKNGSQILPGYEYVMSTSPKIFITTFHGVDIQVDGFTFLLTIMNLEENDFTNYTASISNNAGDPVEYVAELLPENDMKPLTKNPAIGGIVGGIIAVLVAITLAIVGLVFWRRKTGTRPQGEPKSETNKALEEYENISDNKNHSTVSQNRYDTLEMQRRVKSNSLIETNTYDEVGNDQQKNIKRTENKQQDAQSNQNVYEDIKMGTKDKDPNDRESRIYVNLVVW